MRAAFGEFAKHPSPWILLVTLVVTVTARVWIGDWQWTDALVPAVIIAFFPVNEWLIHVGILHWKPRKMAGRRLRISSPGARRG